MFRKKVYGESKTNSCPFCAKTALIKNPQGIPVCDAHKTSTITDPKCACGKIVELREGKWGPFGLCEHCGPVSWKKIADMNVVQSQPQQKPPTSNQAPKTISSNNLDIEDSPIKPTHLKPKEITISDGSGEFRPLPRGTNPNRKEVTIRSDELDLL